MPVALIVLRLTGSRRVFDFDNARQTLEALQVPLVPPLSRHGVLS